MQKLRILLDAEKVKREQNYSLNKMQAAVDHILTEQHGLTKMRDGFYVGNGSEKDYSNFWLAILQLKDINWFMDNVSTFLWFNSDDSDDENDFSTEDLLKHYSRVAV